MSEFKGTPGPWFTGEDDDCETIYASDNGKQYDEANIVKVAIIMRDDGDYQKMEADARLIAAAPDLLEACQTFAEWLRRESAGSTNEPWAGKRDTPEGEAAWREWYDENLRICDLAQEQVRAAIAKATGETP